MARKAEISQNHNVQQSPAPVFWKFALRGGTCAFLRIRGQSLPKYGPKAKVRKSRFEGEGSDAGRDASWSVGAGIPEEANNSGAL